MEPISASDLIGAVAFDPAGLVPTIAQDAKTGDVLMLAWMNRDALKRTLETGDVTYWSRSRRELWRKGATSGHTQRLVEAYIDCDGDTVLLKVEQTGPACHTGAPTCFFRKVRHR
jgi:phosphoribosyl-AMP cyclohydrolase